VTDLPAIPERDNEQAQPGLYVKLEGFELSAEVQAVAERLIASHSRLRPLSEWTLAYLLHHADPPKRGNAHTWASAKLVPKWMRPLTDHDAAVIVNAKVWAVLPERQREALTLHELLHLEENEQGRLEVVPHDVEEFGLVVATYGQWRPSLEAFAEQLSMGLSSGR
jgi:hypothetical protein